MVRNTLQKDKNGRARKQKRSRTGQGDVPVPVKFSQNTSSCKVPRTTPIYTARSVTVSTSYISQNAVAAANPTYFFSLADIDNYTSFTGLFDQYRIDAVRFVLRPTANAIGLVTNSSTLMVPLYCVIDYDDTNALTSAAQARSFETCMVVAPGESCSRTFQPRVAIGAYSGTFTSFANMPPPWIDAASVNVQHYGVKIYVPPGTLGQTLLEQWIVEREYIVSFRKTHG